MARQGKGLRRYCDICRDGDTDLRCSQCGKVFHFDCLRNCNLVGSDTEINEDSFCCPDCKNNEDFCYICRDNETGDVMLYCDGCPKSAHLGCLGLEEEPDSPTWYCPNCDNDSGTGKHKNKQTGDVRTLGGTKKTNDETDINSDSCYVCQKGGKLLGCDFCTYSYHPKCIETEVFAFDGDKWKCPVCRGEDPLKNMRHKRMTKSERYKLSQQWQSCIKKQIKQSSINRDVFLWENRQAISPFVSRKVLERLKKNAETYRKANLNQQSNQPSNGNIAKKRRIRKIQDDDAASDSNSDSSEPNRLDSSSDAEKPAQSLHASDGADFPEFMDAPKYREAHISAREMSLQILSEGIELKDYQRYGVHWLLCAFSIKGGAILADEMGLGKTIQTLTFLACLKALGITGPHLIVVPLSTVGNWAREARRFTPGLTLTKICGSRWEREHAMMDPVASDGLYDLYITTYETVVTEESFFVDNFRWQCIVLDEAHRIKNEGGRIRHSMDRVSGSMRVLLTGTPLQNSLKELFTLLNFLYPDILQDSEIFEKIFQMKDITKSANSSNTSSSGNANHGSDDDENIDDLDALGIKVDSKRVKLFHCLLQKLLLRRTKDLVIKLPDKIIRDIWLPLSPSGWQWYKRLLDVGNVHGDVSFRKLLGLVIKMRICCSHPRGLVARSSQLDKLFNVFAEASPDLLSEVTDEAYKLKSSFGWEHVKGSSKLFFLDKLLMQLHRENCKYIPNYKESHDKYTREQIRSIKSRIFELRNKGGTTPGVGTTSAISSSSSVSGGSNSSNAKDKDSKTSKDNTISEILSFEEGYQVADEFEETFKNSDFKDIYSQYMYDKWSKKVEGKVKIETSEANLDSEKTQANDKGIVKMDVDIDTSTSNNNVKAENGINNNNIDTQQVPISTELDKGSRKCKMHKILIFTQFQLILDELENYCLWRGWQYMRLDGSTNKLIRELDIREFGLPDNYVLVYLICTRAGGLGINLVSANHVVMYDEDWNPFVDLQAVDRAHRIGQTRDVCIWKLVTEWSVEERMVFGREQKLKLDKMIIKGSARDDNQTESADVHSKVFDNDQFVAEEKLSAEEVTKLIRYGRRALMHLGDTSRLFGLDLEALMDRKRVPIPDEDVLMQKEEEEKGDDDIQNVISNEDGQQVTLKADEEVDITDILCDEMDDNPSGANVSCEATNSGIASGSNSTKTASNVNVSPSDEVLDPSTSNTTSQGVGNTCINISPTTSGGDDDSLWRSKRTRKPPPPVYNPLHWEVKSRSSEDKKPTLKHERSCFRCGQAKLECSNNLNKDKSISSSSSGNLSSNSGSSSGAVAGTGCCGSPPNYGDVANSGSNGTVGGSGNTAAIANGKDMNTKEPANSSSSNSQTGVNSKPSGSIAQVDEYMKKMGLINCNRCPKSYHWSQCLGLDKVPPRTWICPWHECCLCFRRATQAGGLLIHCSECPTTFCIDCFPPEYARHQVLDSFFENLNKRGWNVSRDSMILFLCSKCKALQQQEIRKKLSRQQLLEEQQRRRKMNEQLKSDVLKSGQKNLDQFAHLGPNSGNRTSPYISGRKRNIEAAWKLTESLIRKGFERLFPPLLYKLQQEYIQENAKHEAAILAAATSGANGETDPDLEKQIGGLRKSPWMRPPGEWLRLCDNCLLPFHDVSGCPYPLEVVKVSVPSGVTQINVQTGQPLQLADGTKISSMDEFILLSKTGGVDSKFQTRSYCSLCGLSGRMHTRRSCPLLPDEAEQEYEKRQTVLDNFIQTLNTFQVEFPSELTDPDKITGGWESYRKATQKVAEEFLRDCFLSCNLHKIITPSGTAYIGRQNVARSVVYGSSNTGIGQIQGSTNMLGIGNIHHLQSGIGGGMNTSNSGFLANESHGGAIPPGAMTAYLGLGGGSSANSRNSKQSLGRGDQSGIGAFSGCTIPTSSTMSAAAAAIQQRMNDAALSLARARYAAAAAAAAVSMAGFRHPQPILPFPMVQATAPPHPYSIFSPGNPVSAAAAAAAAAASAPIFFGVSNPNIAAAAAAAARANMIVGANMAAASAAATASANNTSTNLSTSSNPPSPPLESKKRTIDALKTENSNGNIINQGTGSVNITTTTTTTNNNNNNNNNNGGYTEAVKSTPIDGESPPNKVKVLENNSNNENPDFVMGLPAPSSSEQNL